MDNERRWIVLSDDGRHVTMGRHSDPTDDEIELAAAALDKQGVGGWLAVTEGVYYSKSPKFCILMVRELALPRAGWDTAVAAFLRLRRDAIESNAQPKGPT